MITADMLTDEQIRGLLKANPSNAQILKVCTCALGLSRGGLTAQRRARRRCADLLNARAAEAK